jgi:hypothetical protein
MECRDCFVGIKLPHLEDKFTIPIILLYLFSVYILIYLFIILITLGPIIQHIIIDLRVPLRICRCEDPTLECVGLG